MSKRAVIAVMICGCTIMANTRQSGADQLASDRGVSAMPVAESPSTANGKDGKLLPSAQKISNPSPAMAPPIHGSGDKPQPSSVSAASPLAEVRRQGDQKAIEPASTATPQFAVPQGDKKRAPLSGLQTPSADSVE
jgi:hypothetical protein